MGKKHLPAFDIMRTIAAYAVIFVHISAIAFTLYQPGTPYILITTAMNRLLKFTTPVFVYLGGVMVYFKYHKKPMNIGAFFKDRFVRILIPYVGFSLFYFLMGVFFHGFSYSFTDFLKQLLTASAKYHLYFIAIITQLYLLSPILYRGIQSKYRPHLLAAGFLITLVSVLYLEMPYSDRIFLKYLFPFMLGLLYGTELLPRLKPKALILGVTAAAGAVYAATFYLGYFGYQQYSPQFLSFIWFFYTNLCIPALLILSQYLSKHARITELALSVTGFSYYIYLVHPAIIDISERLLTLVGIYSTSLRFILTLSITLVVSTWIASKFKRNQGR